MNNIPLRTCVCVLHERPCAIYAWWNEQEMNEKAKGAVDKTDNLVLCSAVLLSGPLLVCPTAARGFWRLFARLWF